VHGPVAGAERRLLDVVGHRLLDEDALEVRRGRPGRVVAVEARHQRPRERVLGVARPRALGRAVLAEQQREPLAHRVVGQRQRLAVHLLGRIGDADVVAQGLRHLVGAVGAHEDRQRQHRLLATP
jgi:hypothetical protein